MDSQEFHMTEKSILEAVRGKHPNIEIRGVEMKSAVKTDRYTDTLISLTAPQTEINLIERVYRQRKRELCNYSILRDFTEVIPEIFHIDTERGILLTEDLSGGYIQGNCFNENSGNGEFIRENIYKLLDAAAKFHAVFWEKYDVFGKIGLDWRLENRNNLLGHIDAMERDFNEYRLTEESGNIPEEWQGMRNRVDKQTRGYFPRAAEILRKEYIGLTETRFNKGKQITLIHGDLHPGNMFVSKTGEHAKIIDLEAVRIGLCTEDLAMLLALHIEPGQNVYRLLKYYHTRLCEAVSGYTFEMLLADYRISVMENMFFPVRLINRGIYDFNMRDRAIKAFETFEG